MGDADYEAALSGEQTELAPSESGTDAHTAWSLDDGPEWKPPFWTAGRITAAAVGAAVVAAIVVSGLVGYHLRSESPAVSAPTVEPTKLPEPTVPPEPTVKAPPPAPPPPAPTVTVTKEAPPPEPEPEYKPVVNMAAFDGQFIQNLKAQGWVVWNEAQSADTARLACSMLTNGASFEYVANHLATVSQARIEEGRVFTSTAMRTYPNCP